MDDLPWRSWPVDCIKTFSSSSIRFSKDSHDGNNDKKEKAKEKLNSLLQSIVKDESLMKEDSSQRTSSPRPLMREKRAQEKSARNLGEQIVNAAKGVAQKIEGDVERNTAELLHKVVAKDDKLKNSVLQASTKSTLNLLLAQLAVEKENQANQRSTMAELRERSLENFSRADFVNAQLVRRMPREQVKRSDSLLQSSSFDIFSGRHLGIFNSQNEYPSELKMSCWDQCAARELKLAFTHPPRNIWEQMIMWTERGMLWKFPIDNEQGLDEEQEVSFVDHVFLEVYLEDWCPKRGPIRHFMELVCVGVSRNHWLNAKEKRDHIMWYKDYFISKKQLIKELGAGEIIESSQPST